MGRFFRALWGFIRDNALTLLLFLAIAGVLVYGLNEAAASSGAEATFTLSVVTALPETSAQDAASVETEIVPAE